ncbi:MAG: hypothetical protein ACP5JY_00905, partial [Candidatus Nanoarchaeia archaeon]
MAEKDEENKTGGLDDVIQNDVIQKQIENIEPLYPNLKIIQENEGNKKTNEKTEQQINPLKNIQKCIQNYQKYEQTLKEKYSALKKECDVLENEHSALETKLRKISKSLKYVKVLDSGNEDERRKAEKQFQKKYNAPLNRQNISLFTNYDKIKIEHPLNSSIINVKVIYSNGTKD